MKKLIAKIKLAIKGRKIVSDLFDVKSKWREPTFWAALLGNVIGYVGTAKGIIPQEYSRWVIIGTSVLTSLYNYARGASKSQADGVRPYYSTSEMVMIWATIANQALIDIHTQGIDVPYIGAGAALMTASFGGSRDAANMEPDEAKAKAPEVAVNK